MCWSLEYLFLSFLSAVFHCYLYSSFVSVAVGVMKKSETDVLITDRFWSLGLKGVAFRRVLSFFRCEVSLFPFFSPACSGYSQMSFSYGFEVPPLED